ncbi:S1 RNA-binding domain-containing protein [Streptomyces sp. 6-11-2]|uniref:S1 RNA-binding domain-containing protein n=1 Tax=Streptomyces sp. 6-11-2 TaxID=2585753 RepID=UPI00114334F3|nr:S1 RNA-binding domain-containing protein [Streptomyces sp. 6-11-2]GED83735.1 hypothetical protein TNCT6_08200 [Streptomyces sp. 6-11-2]
MLEQLRRREQAADEDLVFFAMPYGRKTMPDGYEQNFDVLYRDYFAEAVKLMGLKPDRADKIPGTTESPLQAAWDGIDRAGVVVVDLSATSTSVAMELGWAMCLHKRLVVLHYEGAEVPTNIQGQIRAITYRCDMSGLPEMSRAIRAAIEEVRKPGSPEMDLRPRTGLRDVDAVAEVVWATADRIFVRDVQNELRTGEMRRTDVNYGDTVPEDMAKRYHQGSKISGTFVTDENGTRFSQRYGQVNPWPRLQAEYARGQVTTARVSDLNRGGCFVELASGGKSRIPTHQANAAGLLLGSEVQVRVLHVDPVRQRIDVALAHHAVASAAPPSMDAYPRTGERLAATVRTVVAEHGFVLVELDGYPGMAKPALLHVSEMAPATRDGVEAGSVVHGERVFVEVIEVRPSRRDPGLLDVRVREVDSGVGKTADPAEPVVAESAA